MCLMRLNRCKPEMLVVLSHVPVLKQCLISAPASKTQDLHRHMLLMCADLGTAACHVVMTAHFRLHVQPVEAMQHRHPHVDHRFRWLIRPSPLCSCMYLSTPRKRRINFHSNLYCSCCPPECDLPASLNSVICYTSTTLSIAWYVTAVPHC